MKWSNKQILSIFGLNLRPKGHISNPEHLLSSTPTHTPQATIVISMNALLVKKEEFILRAKR